MRKEIWQEQRYQKESCVERTIKLNWMKIRSEFRVSVWQWKSSVYNEGNCEKALKSYFPGLAENVGKTSLHRGSKARGNQNC